MKWVEEKYIIFSKNEQKLCIKMKIQISYIVQR